MEDKDKDENVPQVQNTALSFFQQRKRMMEERNAAKAAQENLGQDQEEIKEEVPISPPQISRLDLPAPTESRVQINASGNSSARGTSLV